MIFSFRFFFTESSYSTFFLPLYFWSVRNDLIGKCIWRCCCLCIDIITAFQHFMNSGSGFNVCQPSIKRKEIQNNNIINKQHGCAIKMDDLREKCYILRPSMMLLFGSVLVCLGPLQFRFIVNF